MRILMVCALDVWALSGEGGAPSLFRTLAAYGERGHTVDFVCPTVGANHQAGQPPSPPPQLRGVRFHSFHLPSLQESRVPLPHLAARLDQKLRFALLFPFLAARRAEDVLLRHGADLLYGYEVHGALAQRLLRRRRRSVPLVARFQGTVMHPHLDRPLGLMRRFEEVLALRTPADLFIMTDDGTRGDAVLARLNPSSTGKVRFWRNGLDRANVRPPSPEEREAARASLGLPKEAFVLVTTSRLARWKRIDRAVDALPGLLASVPEAVLLVVGDGEERPELEQRAIQRGVAGHMRFVGAVPQMEVVPYLWAADVFLSVNELSNVGNPLLEAMASGRCVLTLDEGDTASVVHDGENGVLLRSGEPESIARALAALASDAELRRGLGAAAAQHASRNFWTWDQRLAAELETVEALCRAAAAGGLGP